MNSGFSGKPVTPRLSEQKNTIQDATGFRMQLDEITFNQIDLRWGSYINPNERILSVRPEQSSVISHFRILDPVKSVSGKGRSIPEKQFVVYREAAQEYEFYIAPTHDKTRSFFELVMSDDFFSNLFTEESKFLTNFYHHTSGSIPSFDFTAPMSPAMYNIINEMQHAPYSGYLKGMYLEAKAVELFLMQVKQLDQNGSVKHSKLKAQDITCLHEIKSYIEQHYDQPNSIADLARMVGINQMKLKTGFKELFGTTVFGCINDMRMQEAKRLLLDEKLYVNEVADRIGYKHPHHFTAAFKRKFGIVPGRLKS